MRSLTVAGVVLALAAHGPAAAKGPRNAPGRAACGKALERGELDALRIAWSWWPSREVSQTIEIKRGRLLRYGGVLKGARSERALTDEEKRELLAALRAARPDKLVWIDRDVKNDQDRVLGVDVLKADGSLEPVGAFVRVSSTWRTGVTAPLAQRLEGWLAPGK